MAIRSFNPNVATARQAMERAHPLTEEYRIAKKEYEEMWGYRSVYFEKLKKMGKCPIPNCNKHITIEEGNDTDENSRTDEEMLSSDEEPARASTPSATTGKMEAEFQLVPPQKAAKRSSPVKITPPVSVTNRFQKLEEIPVPKETKEHPATINLKPRENYNTLLKEITEKFLGTVNKFLYGYINIQALSDENRLKIVQLLTEKEEFILLETTKDRPIKVVLKGLQAGTNTAEIVDDLSNKSFTINRISPMKNYKLQKPLDMFLMEEERQIPKHL
ncbi:hypothetical protein AVEN_38846-1 [Araneus ventricosus]|uniref:Uncharacterized protein n=1 Tax=Araneus ventricosus TaxID=182803 RepID=A0A4Y2MDQ5_ARAVE|nr:hypothetical protein AVEN_38846-1 [Araneus ventricosus]